ncbi:conserved hypothetical protein, partial [Ricinus communis]
MQGRNDMLAALLVFLPGLQHLMPQQGCEQEARVGRLTGQNTLIGIFQRQHDKFLTQRLFQHHVQQRQQTVMQLLSAQGIDALNRMTRQEQLEHLIKQAARRHIFEQVSQFAYRCFCRALQLQTQFGRQTYRAQHAHRIFLVTRDGIANHAQGFGADIGDAMMKVQHFLAFGV